MKKVLSITFLFLMTSNIHAESNKQSLRDLPKFYVAVVSESLPAGISVASLQTSIELELRKAGISIFDLNEAPQNAPHLELFYTHYKSLIFDMDLHLFQGVSLIRDPDLMMYRSISSTLYRTSTILSKPSCPSCSKRAYAMHSPTAGMTGCVDLAQPNAPLASWLPVPPRSHELFPTPKTQAGALREPPGILP